MDKRIIDMCAAGVGLSLEGGRERVLDFFVPSESAVLVAEVNWWTTMDWGFGNGIGVVPARVAEVPIGYSIVDHPTGMRGTFHEAEFAAVEIAAMARLNTDIVSNRPAYADALESLASLMTGQFDLSDWIATVAARPTVDPVARERERAARQREVARLFVRGPDGSKLAVVVVDGERRTAVTGDDPWLAAMARDYATRETLPPLDAWVNWLAAQTPHRPVTLDSPAVVVASGTVAEIAQGMMT